MKSLAYIFLLITFIGCENYPESTFDGGSKISTTELLERESKSLTPDEYVMWANDRSNGLFVSKKIQDVDYILFAKPVDYIVSREFLNKVNVHLDYEKERSELSGLQYFDFRINVSNYNDEFLRYNLTSTNEYEQRISYCAFDMQRDIHLINGDDSIPCEIFHYERGYSIAPYGHFVLAFRNFKPVAKDLTFVFRDNLMHNGFIKLSVDKEVLSHLPKLKVS